MDSVDSNLDGAIPTTTTGGNSCTDSTLKGNQGIRDEIKGVAICKKASKEDKAVCVTSLEKPKEQKKQKIIREEEIRAEVKIEDEDNAFNVRLKRQNLKNLGPIDKFVNPINPEGVTLKVCQQNLIDALDKERTCSVHQYYARWKTSIFYCDEPIFLEQDELMLKETYYRPIIDIIETISKGQLDSPLHLTTYLLNPYYFFKDQSIKEDVMVSDAVFAFLEKFFHHDFEKQD
ncbi:hypothetical protein Tco_0553477 [Tanacetum coccineum]